MTHTAVRLDVYRVACFFSRKLKLFHFRPMRQYCVSPSTRLRQVMFHNNLHVNSRR
jgi:hypothetical protein